MPGFFFFEKKLYCFENWFDLIFNYPEVLYIVNNYLK